MKKKILNIILIFTMIAGAMFGLTGCGNSNNKEGNNKKSTINDLFDETGNNQDKMHIGDYVAYNEGNSHTYLNENGIELCKTDGTLKWRVLGNENGKIKLICDDSIELNASITGDESNEILDKICSIYGNGEGAEGARSINSTDLGKFFNFENNPSYGESFFETYKIPCYYLNDKSIEYDMLLKNEFGKYKPYAIRGGNYDRFYSSATYVDVQYSFIKDNNKNYYNVLPIVILKEDVNITGKNDDGVWQIENSNKQYKTGYTEISSAEDLVKLTKEGSDLSKNYILTNDIDLSEIDNFGQIGGERKRVYRCF